MNGAGSFGAIYRRLVAGLGALLIGSWLAFILDEFGHPLPALGILVGAGVLSAVLAGDRRLAGFAALEFGALALVALRLPILLYVWVDTGPVVLVAVAVLQVPFALAAVRIGRCRGERCLASAGQLQG